MLKSTAALPRSVARAAVRQQARTLATVTDTPVHIHGGLRDQDRIFTNVHARNDWSMSRGREGGLLVLERTRESDRMV